MRAKFRSNSIPALALAMAAIAVGSAASPVAASPVAPAVKADGNYSPSTWVEGGGLGASGETTSITGDAAEPGSGTGSQLPIGLGLLGLGLVALVATMATNASLRRGSRPRLDSYANRLAGSHRIPRAVHSQASSWPSSKKAAASASGHQDNATRKGVAVPVNTPRLIAASFALSVMSAISASPASASNGPLGLPCAATESVQVCQWDRAAPDRRVRTWDGVPLDVRVVLPAEPSEPLPLVAVLGGYPGGLGPADGEFLLPSQVSLAKRGYAVLAISPRGTFHSCGYRPQSTPLAPDACLDGYIRLADSRYEVRDVQHLAGLLADQGYADRKRIGAVGVSYGGGQALQLAALRDRIRLPNGDMVPWLSPEGRAMRIAGVTAATAWHDLGYSFVPNGRLTATGAAEEDAGRRPPGVMKASLYAGFEGLSILGFLPTEPLPTYHPPPGRDPDADFYGWGAALEKGEPYEDPVVKHMLAELRANHSVAGIPFAGRPAPVLFANGFADDLFPVEEAVRYLARVNDVPGAHAAGLLGNWGHGRSQSNAVDRAVLRARTVAWLDRWVRGDESVEVLSGIEARPLDCGNATSTEPAPSAPARQARDWRGLAAAHRRFGEPGRRLVTSSVVDPAGASVDPVAALGTACKPLAADDAPGVVTYRFGGGEGFTVLGSPVITANVRVLGARAEDTQLAARLWEVDPLTQGQRLISRTLYRPRGGPLAAQRQSFELQGTGWRLPPGREVKLELLGADAPFGRPSNAPFELEITNLELDLPVAD